MLRSSIVGCIIVMFLSVVVSDDAAHSKPRPPRATVYEHMCPDTSYNCVRTHEYTATHPRRGSRQVATHEGAGRPVGCPRAWCGCWLGLKLGMTDRSLWLARNWAKIGRPAGGPVPGAIVVLSRGKRGGHVGIVRGVDADGSIIILSGNHNRVVGVGAYSPSRVIAYRMI